MDSRQCTATSKQSGQRCKRLASPGAAVCVMHGAKAPHVRARASERIVAAEAGALLARNGYEAVTDPVTALCDLAGEVVALKDILGEKVVELREWTYSDKPGREDVRAVLGAYERALDRCHRVLEGMTRLDLDARLMRLAEADARILFGCVAEAIQAVGLSDDQAEWFRRELGANLQRYQPAGGSAQPT